MRFLLTVCVVGFLVCSLMLAHMIDDAMPPCNLCLAEVAESTTDALTYIWENLDD